MHTLQHPPTAGHRPPSKLERVLAGLVTGWKSSRELELAPYFDHCPNATVSELKNRKAIDVEAERIKIPGFAGVPTSIARYRVSETGCARALEHLEQMRRRRGAR